MKNIEGQFRDLLENGAQAAGLPDGTYAAGQYLNPYSINQRGMYGTSAALLVLARSSASPDRIRLIEGIIRYLRGRSDIEHSLAGSETELSALAARLAVEWDTAFKCADLLYALSAAPAAVTGREELINKVLTRIESGRRASGGWSADLDPQRDADPLATASIVRALGAAGVPNNGTDVKLVREAAHDQNDVAIQVRVFCLLALLEVGGRDAELDGLWKKLMEGLAPKLREPTEMNYEFTLGNHYYYVRVPWQLYLLSCAALTSPLRLVFNRHIRRVLLDAVAALSSPQGYIYPASGHMRSSRTYSVLMDTLWRLDQALTAAGYVAPISLAANLGVRIVYSRTVTWVALIGALTIGGLSLWSWMFDQKVFLGAVGPELFSAGVMAMVGLTLSRIRRRR
jgi:hypothetical protein